MKTIAWDVDDVLNNLMFDWFTKHCKKNNISNIRYQDLTENPPHKILKISKESYLTSLDQFRSYNYYQSLEPDKKILDWFNNYGHKARHIVLTSVPYSKADLSAAWIIKYFGKWIRSFNFVPSYRKNVDIPVYDKSKKEFLSWLGNIDILVEDNIQNYSDAKKLGLESFLVKQPWNNSKSELEEVLEKLKISILQD